MINYTIYHHKVGQAIPDKVLVLNKFDKEKLQSVFDEVASKLKPGEEVEYEKDDLNSKYAGGTLLLVGNEKGVNFLYKNNGKKKYKIQPTTSENTKLTEYPKRSSIKKPVGMDYTDEIAKRTGTRKDSVERWLSSNEIDPLTILQGLGSGRVSKQDFIESLLSDEATLEFLRKYNSDGKWKSIWGAKNATQESTVTKKQLVENKIRQIVKKVLKEDTKKYQYKWTAKLPDKSTHSEVRTITQNELFDLLASHNVKNFDELINKWNKMALSQPKSGIIWKYEKLS
jgi:hypothetical protein